MRRVVVVRSLFRALFLLVPLIVFALCSAVFLVPYMWLLRSIWLGFGLNRGQRHPDEFRPVTLAFWVGLCGLLILFGPLSVPFFVAPIWRERPLQLRSICDKRFVAAELPTIPEKDLTPLVSEELLEGPDIV